MQSYLPSVYFFIVSCFPLVYLFIYLFVCLFACLFVYLFIYLFIYLYIYLKKLFTKTQSFPESFLSLKKSCAAFDLSTIRRVFQHSELSTYQTRLQNKLILSLENNAVIRPFMGKARGRPYFHCILKRSKAGSFLGERLVITPKKGY